MAVLAWDPTPYPGPRSNRGAGLSDLGLAVIPPNTRLWNGLVQVSGAALLGTVVSPRFIGPAILRNLTARFDLSNALGEQAKIRLLISADGSGQGSVAYGAAGPLGTSVTETSFFAQATLTNNSYRDGLYLDGSSTARAPVQIPLQFLVTLPEFYLKFQLTNPGGGNVRAEFTVSIWDGLDLNTLIDLLGAT